MAVRLRVDGTVGRARACAARQRGALAGIRCPTLVISGGRDLAYPPGLTRELVAGLPDARHVHYPDAGHGRGARFPEDACAFLAAGRPVEVAGVNI
jgi:pimeloyl-ACP methyl ester carboxylesterase